MQIVTVLLTTFRRPAILERTLAAMSQMEMPTFDWQLIVVDNADDESTRATCQKFHDKLPITYLVCTRPGKNAALNYGLQQATGELIVFTDDDVLPAPNWLTAMSEGAARWPNFMLFGGRVLPDWPEEPPVYVRRLANRADTGRWTYSVLSPAAEEGPRKNLLPMGNNMAVRTTVFEQGILFDERIGPRGRSYPMGSETEFNMRLNRLGYEAVFLPESLVHHQIRQDQLSPKWLVRRAFLEGRGVAIRRPNRSLRGVSRNVKQVMVASLRYYGRRMFGQENSALDMQMSRAHALGQLYETFLVSDQRRLADQTSAAPTSGCSHRA